MKNVLGPMFCRKPVVAKRTNNLELKSPLAGNEHIWQSLRACICESRIGAHAFQCSSDDIGLAVWADAWLKRFMSNAAGVNRA